MSAELIRIAMTCRCCGDPLTLEELHYFDHGDGTATCHGCECEWWNAVEAWRHGEIDQPPERP